MNRRSFLATTSSIALGITAAGCLADVTGPSTPDTDIVIETSETFDSMATHTEPELTVEEHDGDDRDNNPVVEYTMEPTDEECVDLEANVKAYDEDDVVIDEFDSRNTFDPGDEYGITHTITEPPSDVHRIHVGLTVNTLGLMCHA